MMEKKCMKDFYLWLRYDETPKEIETNNFLLSQLIKVLRYDETPKEIETKNEIPFHNTQAQLRYDETPKELKLISQQLSILYLNIR